MRHKDIEKHIRQQNRIAEREWLITIYSIGAFWMSSWFNQDGGSIRAS